jgi:hypothetical protein
MTFVAFLFAVADPWLNRMSGEWIGEGERVQAVSGRHIRIHAVVSSVLRDNAGALRLDSHNQITETAENGVTRSYVRDYWIQPDAAHPGAYELGQGDQVGSRGSLVDGVFEVIQTLGGEPPYVVRSRTRLTDEGSEYTESVLQGERELSHSTVRYHASNMLPK